MVPVIKNKKIVGIITRKDLLRKPEETQLGLLMTSKPIVIEPDMDIREVAGMLISRRIRRLPVVEDGHLIGLLSVADVVAALAQLKIKDEIKDEIHEQVLCPLGGDAPAGCRTGHGDLRCRCDPDP